MFVYDGRATAKNYISNLFPTADSSLAKKVFFHRREGAASLPSLQRARQHSDAHRQFHIAWRPQQLKQSRCPSFSYSYTSNELADPSVEPSRKPAEFLLLTIIFSRLDKAPFQAAFKSFCITRRCRAVWRGFQFCTFNFREYEHIRGRWRRAYLPSCRR